MALAPYEKFAADATKGVKKYVNYWGIPIVIFFGLVGGALGSADKANQAVFVVLGAIAGLALGFLIERALAQGFATDEADWKYRKAWCAENGFRALGSRQYPKERAASRQRRQAVHLVGVGRIARRTRHPLLQLQLLDAAVSR